MLTARSLIRVAISLVLFILFVVYIHGTLPLHLVDQLERFSYDARVRLAMPSTAELQSLSTLEALAVGLPVVAANAGALPELVRDGENGLLFTPEDSAELSERLTQLVTHPALRRRMAKAAIATAAQHDRQRITLEWPRIYAAAGASLRERARSRFLSRARGEGSRWAKLIPTDATKRPVWATGAHRSQRRRAGTRATRLNTSAPPTA